MPRSFEILSANRAPELFDARQELAGHTFRLLREGGDGRYRPTVARVKTPCEWRKILEELAPEHPAGPYRLQLIAPEGVVLNGLRVEIT